MIDKITNIVAAYKAGQYTEELAREELKQAGMTDYVITELLSLAYPSRIWNDVCNISNNLGEGIGVIGECVADVALGFM